MPNISISVKNKIAVQTNRTLYVCGNSDYTALFDLDAEWNAFEIKTARFCYNGHYSDVVFTGNECEIPVIADTNEFEIGLFAGNLHTTTPAMVLCERSILSTSGTPTNPSPDVYHQLIEKINSGMLRGPQGEKGSTGPQGPTAPTTYAPYQGDTLDLQLPETVYGGSVDAVSGQGQNAWKLLTLDGDETWNTWGVNAYDPTVTGFFTYDISDYDIQSIAVVCSNLPLSPSAWGGRKVGVGFATDGNSRYFIYSVPSVILDDISDNAHAIASLKSYLAAQYAAGTPVQIAYKLAKPVPFRATGAQPVPALAGCNTVLTDADSATVTGRADPAHAIAALQAQLATATQQLVETQAAVVDTTAAIEQDCDAIGGGEDADAE